MLLQLVFCATGLSMQFAQAIAVHSSAADPLSLSLYQISRGGGGALHVSLPLLQASGVFCLYSFPFLFLKPTLEHIIHLALVCGCQSRKSMM